MKCTTFLFRRKKSAVINIASASHHVQSIALGKHIPREGEAAQNSAVQRYQLMRQEPPKGLPKLNESQLKALEKALKHNFTLIQGPPGTGKTVLGVYIVFWFRELNARTSRRNIDPKDKNKKDVILYCGPSNKSVDVVAGK
ncbi:Helicase with zinc finger domain 2 [Merluccius polli]|uniref:Helicase with zinc finger domain 2 n=1 Tax=Merluccius polli TaxID=89951 RepID=A0AA47PCH3_MERPO|nr:Helicase with zinc finger domain 2 [Merluccius polli]